MSEVAVLGCGPAGLLAAHAATIMGHHVTIVSSKQKSKISGAQYLHRSIPQIIGEDRSQDLRFIKRGAESTYAEKVYGDGQAPTSWQHYGGKVRVWSMAEAYDALWDRYAELIQDVVIDASVIEKIMESASFDLVISSVPARALCDDHCHEFYDAQVVVIEDTFDYGSVDAQNVIIMSGDLQDPWYRASHIFGHNFVEYPPDMASEKGILLNKPISTTCDCWDEILRVGRYGKWRKGVLAHEAFEDTVEAVCAL